MKALNIITLILGLVALAINIATLVVIAKGSK